jgi:hypothetical protein
MSRLRYNNISGTAAANGLTFANGSTFLGTWVSAPAFPSIGYPDIAVIVVDPGTANEEIVYLASYTAGATIGTFVRSQEGTTGVAHSAVAWVHGPTAADMKSAASREAAASNWR